MQNDQIHQQSQNTIEMTCLKCGQADLIMSYNETHEHIMCPACGYQFLWSQETMGDEVLGKETPPRGAVVIKGFNEIIHCFPIENKKKFNIKKFTEAILQDKDDYIEVYYTTYSSTQAKWVKVHVIEPVSDCERFSYFNLYKKDQGLISERIPKDMTDSDIEKEIRYIIKNKAQLTAAEYIYYNKEKKLWYRRPILEPRTTIKKENNSWLKNIFRKKEKKEKRHLFYKK